MDNAISRRHKHLDKNSAQGDNGGYDGTQLNEVGDHPQTGMPRNADILSATQAGGTPSLQWARGMHQRTVYRATPGDSAKWGGRVNWRSVFPAHRQPCCY